MKNKNGICFGVVVTVAGLNFFQICFVVTVTAAERSFSLHLLCCCWDCGSVEVFFAFAFLETFLPFVVVLLCFVVELC